MRKNNNKLFSSNEKSIFPREIAGIARKERRAGVAQRYMRAWAVVLALPKK